MASAGSSVLLPEKPHARQELARSFGGEREAGAQVGILLFERAQAFRIHRTAALSRRGFQTPHALLGRVRAFAKHGQLFTEVEDEHLELLERR